MDLYEQLGVKRSASLAEMRRAYQKAARRLHPDLNPGDPIAAERFRAVSKAFEVLSDPARRAAYDRGERPSEPSPERIEVGFEGFDFSAEVRTVGAGFREIFDGILRPRPPAAGGVERGEDLEQVTRLSFAEALAGARRRVQLVRFDPCPICLGTGDVPAPPVTCSRCRGSGRLRTARGHMIFSQSCGECGGRGFRDTRACSRCQGEGRLMQGEWLDVEIPAGVHSGSRVRLPECGNAGRRGGTAGDFVLTIEVEPDPLYKREGDDLSCEVPVTVTEAALGAHVEVPTPDGPVTIELPAGTQPGQRFRLRKRGAPRLDGNGRGDLWVQVRLVVPTVTDARGRELLGELARLHPHSPRQALRGGATAGRAGATSESAGEE